jgi:NADPH:quinone reductase-like Zn-dependent oxidoreductase
VQAQKITLELRLSMKAMVFSQYGGPDVLRYVDMPDPVAQAGEVVVDVYAASVNGADHKVRRGDPGHPVQFPHILGRDFSGVVSAAGPEVQDFAVGDAVFGVLDRGKEGTYAQKLAIDAAIIARKPEWLEHVDAAAMGLAGLTALWAIEDTALLKAGETILIHGGAGGVAGLAIQLAHHLGAKVITTASAVNHDYVKSLGAEQVIDYTTQDFTKVVEPCDVVFDTVGGDTGVRSYEVLKPGGRLVWIAATPAGFVPTRQDVVSKRPAVLRDRAHLQRMLTLLEAGQLKVPPIQRFPLEQAARAHRISEGRHLRGKLVLEVR